MLDSLGQSRTGPHSAAPQAQFHFVKDGIFLPGFSIHTNMAIPVKFTNDCNIVLQFPTASHNASSVRYKTTHISFLYLIFLKKERSILSKSSNNSRPLNGETKPKKKTLSNSHAYLLRENLQNQIKKMLYTYQKKIT